MKNLTSFFLVIFMGCQTRQLQPQTDQLSSPTQSLLQAVSIVDENTIWISGHNGSFVRSTNGGDQWLLFKHPTGDTLQFRDIHAFDENKAILMSAGPGPLSRIFTFSNNTTWEENFVMKDSLGFLDCIDFWDERNGIAYGDAIDNYPYILLTSDGGQNWNRADTTNMPLAGKGEGGFAASGTCVTTGSNGKAWIGTGASGNCRILFTQDYGKNWESVVSPLVQGEAAGNTSVSFSGNTGFLTGGDLLISDSYTNNCAFSFDHGETWALSNHPVTKGAFYGGAITEIENQYFTFACGPNGLDYTDDLGQTWVNLDTLDYWAVAMKGKTGFATGRGGKILRISLQP